MCDYCGCIQPGNAHSLMMLGGRDGGDNGGMTGGGNRGHGGGGKPKAKATFPTSESSCPAPWPICNLWRRGEIGTVVMTRAYYTSASRSPPRAPQATCFPSSSRPFAPPLLFHCHIQLFFPSSLCTTSHVVLFSLSLHPVQY